MRSVADLSRHLVKDYDEVQTLLDRGNHLRYSQLLPSASPHSSVRNLCMPTAFLFPPPCLSLSLSLSLSVSLCFCLSVCLCLSLCLFCLCLSLSVFISLSLFVSLFVSLSLSLPPSLSLSPPPPFLSPFLVRFPRVFEADLALLLTPLGSFCIIIWGCLQGLKQRI